MLRSGPSCSEPQVSVAVTGPSCSGLCRAAGRTPGCRPVGRQGTAGACRRCVGWLGCSRLTGPPQLP